MDKSCGSFHFGTLCSTKWALAWLLPILAVTLELWTHTHAHHCFSSLRLITCDHDDSGEPAQEQVALLCIFFERKSDDRTQSTPLCTGGFSPSVWWYGFHFKCCVSGLSFSVAYGNVLPPMMLHLLLQHHSPPSLWSASRWHSCLASSIAGLWWMRRPHLHNSGGAGVCRSERVATGTLWNCGHPREVRNISFLFKENAAQFLKCVSRVVVKTEAPWPFGAKFTLLILATGLVTQQQLFCVWWRTELKVEQINLEVFRYCFS